MKHPWLIGIGGPSCSGKSEGARRLARILRAPMLALDAYYRTLGHLPLEERANTNFDAPDALDAELIVQHVRSLKHGKAVDEPLYDFARHERTATVRRVHPADYVIVEGLFALYWHEVRELLDFRIYIGAEHETCLARRIYRDVRERGRTEESVRRQFETTVRPMAEQWVAPTAQYADLVLEGGAPLKQSVYSILLRIAERLEDRQRGETVRQALDIWRIATEESTLP
jgi:uridine kinase